MSILNLNGCSPFPLSGYLKALGVLRILSQQRPSGGVAGHWQGHAFVLQSPLNEEETLNFFLQSYRPTPIVAPWNGGSGFFPKDNATALTAIANSKSPSFSAYRETINSARSALTALNLKEKPEKDAKERLLLRCRNTFPEGALEWLDSAFVLTEGGAKYPPLLGTGGNDGRLEFTNNFMQRLAEVFDLETGKPNQKSATFLSNALFGTPIKGLEDNPIGQFSPAASGGANATTGFDAKSAVNPWDFILALEGAVLFAAAAVKKLEEVSPGQLVYPFCVQASGSGYGSSSLVDESDSRCEIWMPLWSKPSNFNEIKTLFSEGRAWAGRRPAKNGLDFALAIASLGVDRGIAEFQRFGFHVRNGLAYFATPLQRFRVRRDSVAVDLLATCDEWLSRFLQKAKSDNAPGSIRRAAARFENAIFSRIASSQQQNPSTALDVLVALGNCEKALATCSAKWREESFLKPIPPLPRSWISQINDGSVEFRLAAALSSMGARFKNEFLSIRNHLEPVKITTGRHAWSIWNEDAKNEVVWSEGSLVTVLSSIMRRRIILATASGMDSWPEYAHITVQPTDIAAFIENRIDEARLAEILWGVSLIDFFSESKDPSFPITAEPDNQQELPPAFYCQLKLCFASFLPEEKKVSIDPAIFNLAASGDGTRASELALRRLHGSRIPITHIKIPISGEAAQRAAAALIFPLGSNGLAQIGKTVAPNFFPARIQNNS